MDASKPKALQIELLGKKYDIACPQGQEEELQASAAYLDMKLKLAKSQAQARNLDYLALMTALNIAHEVIKAQSRITELEAQQIQQKKEDDHVIEKLTDFSRTLDSVLSE